MTTELKPKPRVRISYYYFDKHPNGSEFIVGKFGHGHPTVEAGEIGRSSPILVKDKGIVETKNTIFILDQPLAKTTDDTTNGLLA
jgi:hypothetical protein